MTIVPLGQGMNLLFADSLVTQARNRLEHASIDKAVDGRWTDTQCGSGFTDGIGKCLRSD